jgi:hypothetical protein
VESHGERFIMKRVRERAREKLRRTEARKLDDFIVSIPVAG